MAVAAIVMSLAAMGTALAAAAGAREGAEREGKPRLKGTRKIAVREAKKVDKARKRANRAERELKRARAAEKKAKAKRKAARKKRGKAPKPSKTKPSARGYKVQVEIERKKKKKKKARKLDLPKPTKKKKKKKKVAEPADVKRTPKRAAKVLYRYVRDMVDAGKASGLGTRAKKNRKIAKLQRQMKRLTADGIYGPKTRARGKELLGKPFPSRRSKPAKPSKPSKPEPSDAGRAEPSTRTTDPDFAGSAEEEAARGLLGYARAVPHDATRAAKFGYRNNTNDTIEAFQLGMGMSEEDADGIYGPQTRDLGKALTGETYPAR